MCVCVCVCVCLCVSALRACARVASLCMCVSWACVCGACARASRACVCVCVCAPRVCVRPCLFCAWVRARFLFVRVGLACTLSVLVFGRSPTFSWVGFVCSKPFWRACSHLPAQCCIPCRLSCVGVCARGDNALHSAGIIPWGVWLGFVLGRLSGGCVLARGCARDRDRAGLGVARGPVEHCRCQRGPTLLCFVVAVQPRKH